MRLFTTTLILLASLCLSGCVIPYKYTDRQKVSGHLVDYDSWQPVSDATITLSSEYEKSVSVPSETNGDFVVPSVRRWSVFILIQHDRLPQHWILTIVAPGYQKYIATFNAHITENRPIQLGTITLKKEPTSVGPPPDSKASP